MLRAHLFYRSVLCLLVAALLAPALRAQVLGGNLVGTILDSSGAAVPSATVTATNTATGVSTSTTANGSGEYRFSDLLPGTYDLKVTAAGFAAAEVRGVTVRVNATITAPNITMQVGTVSTSVVVTEAAATIDTTTAQIQNTFNTAQTRDLPNSSIGLGVINLSLLDAGVASAGGIGVGAGPSVSGQRPRNNNFMIDGVDNNSKSVTGPVVYVPNESVEEFSVIQNQFQAQYGHSAGAQFNTNIKSGTNSYHGTLYEYLQNRIMDAVDQSYKNQGIYKNPRYDQNHLGANFGGPIQKNKLFFFTSFEYNPLGQAPTVGTPIYAPTAAGYAALASAPGISQTNLKVLQQYAVAPSVTPGAPTVTVNGVTVPTGVIPVAAPAYRNGYYGVASVDYNISDSDQLRGRYIYNRYDSINTGADLPAFYTPVPSRYHLGTLAEYHTFNPHATNELRLAYQRSNTSDPVGNQTFPGLSAFPNLQFNDLNLQVGPNPNFPQSGVNNEYQMADDFTWIKGNHTFKFGTEFRDYISPQFFVQRVRGDYEWTHVANYLLDLSPDYFAARSFGGSTYYGNQLASYSYIQDTWRARQNLTVDLGVRYEYTTVPLSMQAQSQNAIANVPGVLTFQKPTADPYGIAPRIGLAWTPAGSSTTVIRAGFGIAYDVIFDNIGLNTVPIEFYTTTTLPTNTITSNFLANGGITAPSSGPLTPAQARAQTSSWIPNQFLPYSINYTFDIQHIFANNYTVDIRYVGDKGVHLIFQTQLNRQSPVTATQNIPTFLTAPSPAVLASLPYTVGALRAIGSAIPAFQNAGFTNTITAYVPDGYSQYNGLQLQLNRHFSNGLQYQLAYTWSHAIDNSTAEVASTYLTPRRPQDFLNLAAEKASSALDHRQRFTAAVVYDAPWFKSKNSWLLKNVIGNWEVAPVYTYESPEYYTVQSGIDSNLNGDSAADRTIINPNGIPGTGSGVYGLTRNGTVVPISASAAQINQVVAWVARNPNAQYIQAGYGAYATAGRNTAPTRPVDNVDLALVKHFTFGERYRFDLEGHAYNLFNHPQFVPVAIDNATSVNTYNTGTLSFVTASSPNFNNPTLAFSSNPRYLQVVARFTW
jgi:hypothetical protein